MVGIVTASVPGTTAVLGIVSVPTSQTWLREALEMKTGRSILLACFSSTCLSPRIPGTRDKEFKEPEGRLDEGDHALPKSLDKGRKGHEKILP